MSYITINELPEIPAVSVTGNEYIMVTNTAGDLSSKFKVDSMVQYVGEHFDNTVDNKLLLKVDKIEGMGLSAENFTTDEKNKLELLNNYIHPESTVVPGNYTKVEVNEFGHIISGENPTTLNGYGINDAVNVELIGASEGIAELDIEGLLKDEQTRKYVLEFSNTSLFPTIGSSGKLYVALDINRCYRWNGTSYIQISSLVDSVAGKTGTVILTKADVQLSNVNNTADSIKNVLSATKFTTARTINNVLFDGTSNILIEANDPSKVISNISIVPGTGTKITYDAKGLVLSSSSLVNTDIPNLDASKITTGIIDSARLPSYVDDVLEFTNFSGFPEIGELGKIYIDLETNKTYRWAGSVYVYITSGAVDSVAGKTGVVTLDKSDVGLNLVDNTSDIDKPISTATQGVLDLKSNIFTTLAGYTITDAYTKIEVDDIATTKQNVLISGTNIKTINDTSIVGSGNLEITVGSGGYAANVYLTTLVSSTVGTYNQISYTPDSIETILSATVNNNEVLLADYIFDGDVKATSIPAGEWGFNFHTRANSNIGESFIRFELFKRSSLGVETILFSKLSNEINNNVFELSTLLITEPVFVVSEDDRIGIKVYASTTNTSDIIIDFIVGNGSAAYFTTPLEIRHNQLRARSEVDSHPIAAITDLQTELDNRVIKNVNITPGTYKSVTVDAKGLITAGTNPTTLSGFGITDAYTKTQVQTNLPKVGFDVTNVIAPSAGQLAWNQDESTIDIGLNGATLQIGQEQLIRVRNNTASSINNGDAVMATGTLGNSGRITVAPANLTQSNAKYILGVVTETIAPGSDGFCTVFGKIRNINTTGTLYGETWNDGDVLYVKDSGNGVLTKVQPTDDEVKLPIAIVIHAHTSGTIFVRVNSIDENHAKAELALKANKVLIAGAEYLTEMSRNTKQVYGIEVDLGSMPNTGTKDVAFTFNAAYTYWIDIQNSYCSDSTASYPLNYTGNIGESMSCYLDITNNKIKILTSNDKSTFDGKLVILYTK